MAPPSWRSTRSTSSRSTISRTGCRRLSGYRASKAMLTHTRDMVLRTTVTGSYPRPLWFDRSLEGRSFKAALGDSLFREQYLDAVASIIGEQEAAGLDIVTDGDSR